MDADERTQLQVWLDMQREVVYWKAEGLSDEDAHRVVLPTSPLMTMAGLVSHLRWVENTWFEVMMLDRPAEGPQFDGDVEDADMLVEGVPIDRLVDEYRQQCAISDGIIDHLTLDSVGLNRDFRVGEATLRWVMFHMIEETARHAGHADVIRELLDGSKGYY